MPTSRQGATAGLGSRSRCARGEGQLADRRALTVRLAAVAPESRELRFPFIEDLRLQNLPSSPSVCGVPDTSFRTN